jgi:hypothetical protein
VLQADKNIPSYKAEQKVKELLAQTIDEDLFEDEVFSFESYSINKTVENYNNIEGVYKVVFKVKTANKIHSYKYVIN